jgi:hypothetical protein
MASGNDFIVSQLEGIKKAIVEKFGDAGLRRQ